ncbi:hypothetical protein HYFRA_00003248, partial [Hymenoscyphus fraxineus]
MTFGREGTASAQVFRPLNYSTMLGVSQARGHNQADICRLYNEGISEECCAAFEWKKGGLNALNRNLEPELSPYFRNYGIELYTFSPLAGCYFTSCYTREATVETGSQFDDTGFQGMAYRTYYWDEEYFTALDTLCIDHHSLLKRELEGATIIGLLRGKEQLEENMRYLDAEKELPNKALEALDKGWKVVKGV